MSAYIKVERKQVEKMEIMKLLHITYISCYDQKMNIKKT